MQDDHARTLINVVLITVIAILATTSLATPVFAQGRVAAPRESPGARLRRERAERQMSELELRSVEKLGKTKPIVEDRSARVIYEQISADFQRMQVVQNEMMQAAFPSKSAYTPDSKKISKSTEEINKLASRLLTNLRLPETENKEQKPANEGIVNVDQLKSALLGLDSLVMSFISNPTFERPTVVDLAQSGKAKRDLQEIIELSRRIKQGSEKLRN